MAQIDLRRKLAVLADAAKYDASCASSGSAKRDSLGGRGIGSTEGMGICHAYTPDGRCVSLLKILLTNFCIYDCAYCIKRAALMVVGEQPGDQEDLVGRPFTGPAGRLLDAAFEEAGLHRRDLYLTNAVKHFKHEPRGKRRLHRTPSPSEVQACRWWLDHERRLVKPRLILALGATAGLAVLGRKPAVQAERGRVITADDGARVFLTVHPAYLLRLPDPAARDSERAKFLADLRVASAEF